MYAITLSTFGILAKSSGEYAVITFTLNTWHDKNCFEPLLLGMMES
jgi:hypothetical protein